MSGSIAAPPRCTAMTWDFPPPGRVGRWSSSASRCTSLAAQAEHEGRGFVQSSDVVNVGFTQGESSYVVVQVVYDEPAVLDDYEGVNITRLTHELTPQSPFGRQHDAHHRRRSAH